MKEIIDGGLRELFGGDLHGANLRGANLSGADLSGVNLQDANLVGANLVGANLKYANLRRANLQSANLEGATLKGARLRYANLQCANLLEADLLGADLQCANLKNANLLDAKFSPNAADSAIPICCPGTGSFIGWKKCQDSYIVKLEIPNGAKRSSATGRKCRCNKAKVLSIETLDGKPYHSAVSSSYDESFIYAVGTVVSVNDFCDDRFRECAPGIHFFITRQEAVDYEYS